MNTENIKKPVRQFNTNDEILQGIQKGTTFYTVTGKQNFGTYKAVSDWMEDNSKYKLSKRIEVINRLRITEYMHLNAFQNHPDKGVFTDLEMAKEFQNSVEKWTNESYLMCTY